MSRVVLGKPSFYIYGHPFPESLPVTAHYLPFCEKKKPFQEQEKPIRKRIVLSLRPIAFHTHGPKVPY